MSVREQRAPETLAERFWSLARGMEKETDSTEPVEVVQHVLRVLDALDSGKVGAHLTANTLNFLALLRQYEMKGDLLYASPEQARGEQVDERSLVFSVGVLLFEKLTGRHPFGAEGNPQRLARIRRGEMASGVNYFPMVPAELRVVLVKAMGPFPEERWNNLSELRSQLERFVDKANHPGDYTGPTVARPLPGANAAAESRGDEEPTQILNRRPPEPAVDLPRMARVSARHQAIRLDTQPATLAPPTVEVSLGTPEPRRRLSPVLIGMLVGAVAASIGFWAAWPKKGAAPRPAPVAAIPAPTATPMPMPPPPPTQTQTQTNAPPAPTAAPTPAATAPAAPEPAQAAAAFDKDVGGTNALAAARSCFAPDRRVQFGASLLYDPRTGRSRKIYFGATQQLQPAERACLDKKLIGLDAGAPPKTGAVVTYSFHVTPSGGQVRSHLAPP